MAAAEKKLSIGTSGIRFNVFCIAAALITYMSMYAFRKPISAATFEGISYWGADYKIIALISQVVGYTCSMECGLSCNQRTASRYDIRHCNVVP